MMTHLYAGGAWLRGAPAPTAETACGLTKAYESGHPPADVVMVIGSVTCPKCLEAMKVKHPNGLSNGDFPSQQGKKAQ